MSLTIRADIANDDGIEAAAASLRDAIPTAKLTILEMSSASGWPHVEIKIDDADIERFAEWYGLPVDEIVVLEWTKVVADS